MTLLKSNNFTATPILREIKFWWFHTVQKCHFWQFRQSELWNLVNLGLKVVQIYQKSKFRTAKIGKNNIFGPFELGKIRFHVKSEWGYNDQSSTKSSLNFTFWKFLEHSVIGGRSRQLFKPWHEVTNRNRIWILWV